MTDEGRLIDELAARATVARFDELVEGWWCKAAPDLPFRRCNAVLPPIGAAPAGDGSRFDDAIETVEGWYDGFRQRVIVQVSTADPRWRALDDVLARRGYEREAPVHLMVGPIPVMAPPASDIDPTVEITIGVDPTWAARYGTAHGGDRAAQRRTEAYGRMLTELGDRAIGAAAVVDDRVAGVGLGVLDDEWLGIFGMGTAPWARRRGVARAVVAGLSGAASNRGAGRAYLQVETDNEPARALYEGLGFTRHHGYHYRVSGPA